jgi:hypothetical protein
VTHQQAWGVAPLVHFVDHEVDYVTPRGRMLGSNGSKNWVPLQVPGADRPASAGR